MAHWRVAIFFLQLYERMLKDTSEPIQGLDHRDRIEAETTRDTRQRHALQIMLADDFAQQLIA